MSTSQRAFRAALVVLGGVATTTGIAAMARGTSVVRGAPPAHAGVESEHRFFAASWTALGVALWSAVPRPAERGAVVRGAAATVFAGGVARLAAMRETGPPDPLYRALAAVELVLPPALVVWHERLRRAARAGG